MRSSPTRAAAKGLVFAEGSIIQHHAFRVGQAGLVELWRPRPRRKPNPADAFAPWEEGTAGARSVDALCRRIARLIKSWIDEGEELPAEGPQR